VENQHDNIAHVGNILQRVRELAVQGANGTYSAAERKAMAMEVNELLEEITMTANSKYKDEYIFAGARSAVKPFRIQKKSYEGMTKPMIEKVNYLGNNISRKIEVNQDDHVAATVPGSRAFWGEKSTVVSMTDAANYVSQADQKIRIDGTEVEITAGDTLGNIISKINNNVPSVNAYRQELPNGNQTLALESSYSHKLSIEDIEGGTVMQDLGVLKTGTQSEIVYDNIHPNTLRQGGSVFDTLIRFRNSLLDNNVKDIGSIDLGAIDTAMGNILESQSKISSLQTRLNEVEKKLAKTEEFNTERLSKNEDVDVAEESVKFNQLLNVHKIALMTTSKLVQPTLMDYMR